MSKLKKPNIEEFLENTKKIKEVSENLLKIEEFDLKELSKEDNLSIQEVIDNLTKDLLDKTKKTLSSIVTNTEFEMYMGKINGNNGEIIFSDEMMLIFKQEEADKIKKGLENIIFFQNNKDNFIKMKNELSEIATNNLFKNFQETENKISVNTENNVKKI